MREHKKAGPETGVKSDLTFCLRPFIEKKSGIMILCQGGKMQINLTLSPNLAKNLVSNIAKFNFFRKLMAN